MDQEAQRQLFAKLGSIEAKLDTAIQDNQNQWHAISKQDERLRKQEVRSGSISAVMALVVSIGVDAIKKGIGP